MKRENLNAMLLLARIVPISVHEIANKYWPDNEYYAEVRRNNPWWLVLTQAGPVVIGWRKRVISIGWKDTRVRAIVTPDDTDKGEDYVHAWNYGDAVKYLTSLRYHLEKESTCHPTGPVPATQPSIPAPKATSAATT